jgi:hypothetical protein
MLRLECINLLQAAEVSSTLIIRFCITNPGHTHIRRKYLIFVQKIPKESQVAADTTHRRCSLKLIPRTIRTVADSLTAFH